MGYTRNFLRVDAFSAREVGSVNCRNQSAGGSPAGGSNRSGVEPAWLARAVGGHRPARRRNRREDYKTIHRRVHTGTALRSATVCLDGGAGVPTQAGREVDAGAGIGRARSVSSLTRPRCPPDQRPSWRKLTRSHSAGPELTPCSSLVAALAYASIMRSGRDNERPQIQHSERPIVIFDGDDTLWETEPLYDIARSEAERIVTEAGLNGQRFEELQRTIDIDNFSRMGLSPTRFPTSSVQAYESLALTSGFEVSESTSRKVYSASADVFDRVAPLRPHAQDVLENLGLSYRLILLTKGDENVQTRRIDDSGLARYFTTIRIVPDKDATAFRDLLAGLRARADAAWSVGNSLPSDILPAVESGMNAIWIDAHVWGHERLREQIPEPRIHRAQDLSQVPVIICGNSDSHNQFERTTVAMPLGRNATAASSRHR